MSDFYHQTVGFVSLLVADMSAPDEIEMDSFDVAGEVGD